MVAGISRFFNAVGKLAFMEPEYTRIAEETLKKSIKQQGYKNIHTKIKDCFVKAEEATKHDSFLGGLKRSVLDFPSEIKAGWANKGVLGKLKGIGGPLVRRLPLLFAAFEIPNILSAFQDKGLIGGATEVVKTGTRMAGGMAGFIAGQALIPIPIIGGLIGAIGADWLIGKVIGKSHTEQKEEAIAQAQEAEAQALALQQQLAQQQMSPYNQQMNPYAQQMMPQFNVPRMAMSPQQIMAMQQMLYGGGMTNPMEQDFMAMTSGMNRLNYMC